MVTGSSQTSMTEIANPIGPLPTILKTLIIGIPAGFLLDRPPAPIPWMIGAMIAVAAFNMMGLRMYSVPYGRQMGQVILGSAVSLYFTPAVVAELAAHLP